MDPASQTHGATVSELTGLLWRHLQEQGSRCRVITEPGIVPRVLAADNFRIADLGVTCSEDRSSHVTPDPLLLIEVLSPSNHGQTRSNVWTYTSIPSVQEILVTHSTRLEAELLRRQPDGSWPDAPETIHPPGLLELASVGFSVPLIAIYRMSGLV